MSYVLPYVFAPKFIWIHVVVFIPQLSRLETPTWKSIVVAPARHEVLPQVVF